MKILVIAPFVPWPLAHGGRIRLYHLLRELARHNEVTLLCLAGEPAPETGPLPEFCHEVVTVLHRPSPLAAFLRFLAGPLPYNAARFVSQPLAEAIRRLRAATPFDFIHLETTHIWSAAAACGSTPLILGTQNVESRILSQLQKVCRNPVKRLLYRLETARMRSFEEDAWRSCQLCVTVSDDERRAIIATGVESERVVTIPNGVDLERFSFRKRPEKRRLLFLGGLDYHPNLDAVHWLLDEIWPLIRQENPAAELFLAGRNTTAIQAAQLPEGVFCLGDPLDVPDCFASADMLLVPLRIGAGTRLKILEAMAAGLPVVTTSTGCEGIAVVAGVHLLVADTPLTFAAACTQLLTNSGFAAELAAAGRKLVEERYTWGRVVAGMEMALSGIIRRKE